MLIYARSQFPFPRVKRDTRRFLQRFYLTLSAAPGPRYPLLIQMFF